MPIVDFQPHHADAFLRLNEAWITRHFALEPKDLEVLENPQAKVIDPGGRIFMAIEDGAAVGCVALIPMADGGFEVAKMTVAEGQRGSGLGKALLQRCIDAAAEARAPRLFLETNSALAPALALYRAMGFRDLAGERHCTEYVRCDVWMERLLP